MTEDSANFLREGEKGGGGGRGGGVGGRTRVPILAANRRHYQHTDRDESLQEDSANFLRAEEGGGRGGGEGRASTNVPIIAVNGRQHTVDRQANAGCAAGYAAVLGLDINDNNDHDNNDHDNCSNKQRRQTAWEPRSSRATRRAVRNAPRAMLPTTPTTTRTASATATAKPSAAATARCPVVLGYDRTPDRLAARLGDLEAKLAYGGGVVGRGGGGGESPRYGGFGSGVGVAGGGGGGAPVASGVEGDVEVKPIFFCFYCAVCLAALQSKLIPRKSRSSSRKNQR